MSDAKDLSQMTQIKLSIVTVTFNDLQRLQTTLQSIYSQTDQSFEYLVIDGASTDGTIEYLTDFKRSRPMKIYSEKDKGLYDAMNKGARLATGDFLLYLNAGDTLLDAGSTARLNNELTLNGSEIDAVYSDVMVSDSTRGTRLKRAHGVEFLYKGLPSSHQALLMRRRHCFEFPFNTKFRLAADYDMCLRVFNSGRFNWRYLDQPFTVVTTGGLSDVRRYDARIECIKVLKESGTKAQKISGSIYQIKMIAIDFIARTLRALLGTEIYAKLTPRRWNKSIAIWGRK